MRLHHRVDGPDGRARTRALSVARDDARDVGAAGGARSPARFRVVRYDRRGHGRSPVPPGPYSIDDLGRDVLELLDELGIERASFCGLSLGGLVGMWLAVGGAGADRPARALLHGAAPSRRASSGSSAPRRVRARGRRGDRGRRRSAAGSRRPRAAALVDRFRAMLAGDAAPRGTRAAARRSPTPTCTDRLAGDRGADARRHRRGRPGRRRRRAASALAAAIAGARAT